MKSAPVTESDPRSRPLPHTFCPPRLNRFVAWGVKLYVKSLIRRQLKVVQIDIADEDLATLRALRGKRCLLMPSHSGGFEPYIIMYLSRLLRDDYYYLAAMEAFQRNRVIGWIMQRIGAYSIIRGTADRPSFQMTRRILAEGKRWLVIFAEGQTVWQNDTVIPFQEGVVQLAFKGYEDAVKADEGASLMCVPIAIKYLFLQNMDAEIEASLARLEAHLFDKGADVPAERYARLRRIAEAVLIANEKKHGMAPDEGVALDDRIQRMKERIVRDVEAQLEITPRADQLLLDRIRGCFNEVDRIVSEAPDATAYERKLLAEQQAAVQDLYEDLWRVLQFVAIYDGYVGERQTPERFMDVLCLLEMEVFKTRRIWGPRRAVVKVGAPVDLRDYSAAYQADKRATVRTVCNTLESTVRTMLESLAGREGED